MSYSLTSAQKTKYLNREVQICNIVVSFLSGTSQPDNITQLILTEEDLATSGLNIDRALLTGNTIEFGTAISAEATLLINNTTGAFNDYHFEGARVDVYIGLKTDGRNDIAQASGVTDVRGVIVKQIVNAIPMGTFWVDNCPRRLKRITLSCLDSFAKLDNVIPSTGHGISSEATVTLMIEQICSHMGLTLYNPNGVTFSNYISELFQNQCSKNVKLPTIDGKLTYRALFQYCIQFLGGYAFMDWDNKVHIAKFNTSSVEANISTSDRYSSDIQEGQISVTGISITYTDSNDEEAINEAGTMDYAISIQGNPLFTSSNITNSASNIKSSTFNGFAYYPFSVKCKPFVWLYPLDKITITNQSGTVVSSYVTNTNFTLNGTVNIESKGETKTEKGWASSNAFTAQQASIIESVAKQDTSDLRQKYQDVLGLNEALAKSMGLWKTKVGNDYYFYTVASFTSDPDDPEQLTQPLITQCDLTYYHAAAGQDIEGKDVVYKLSSSGIGVSTRFTDDIDTYEEVDALHNGEPSAFVLKLAYSYGATKDGNAVLNRIKAYKITADEIQTGTIYDNHGNTYFNLDESVLKLGGSDNKTIIDNGKMSMYSVSGNINTGEITSYEHATSISGGTPTTNYYSFGIFCNAEAHDLNNKYVRGIDFGYIDENGDYKLMASVYTPKYDNTPADFWGTNRGIIETGFGSNRNIYAGLVHHRYYNNSHYFTKFGCAFSSTTPKISFEAWDGTSSHSDARLDCYYDTSPNNSGITLEGTYSTNGFLTAKLNFDGTYLRWNGHEIANASGVSPGSHIDKKKNVKRIDFSATDVIKASDIYSFNYNDQGDLSKPLYGLVIGDGYKTPSEVISDDGKTIALYSMVSIGWAAIKELSEELSLLESKLNELKIQNKGGVNSEQNTDCDED